MVPRRARILITTAFLILGMTAGCMSGTPTTDEVNAKTLDNVAENRYNTVDGYTATVSRTVTIGENTTTARATVTTHGAQQQIRYLRGQNAGTTTTQSVDRPIFTTTPPTTITPIPASYTALTDTLSGTHTINVEKLIRYHGAQTAVVTFTPTTETPTANATVVSRTVWINIPQKLPVKIIESWTTPSGQPVTVETTFADVHIQTN